MASASMKEEEKEDFARPVQPQKQVEGYVIRVSAKSHLKILWDAVTHPNKPIAIYHEYWCDYHDGWHVTLRSPDEEAMKCYENELLKRGEIKKPKESKKAFDF